MSIHEGFLALAATSIDFELDEYERAELDRHLAGCSDCRRDAAAFRDDAAAIASDAGPRLSPERSAAILAAALRPGKSSPPLRLLAVAALIAIIGGGAAVAGALYLGRSDDPPQAVVPTPTPSSTLELPSPSEIAPIASSAASSQPASAPPASEPPPDSGPPAGARPLVRGSGREIGARIRMAPAADGNLYVSIPTAGGHVLALLDRDGRVRTGWPVTLSSALFCDDVLPVDDGSVRVLCAMTNPGGVEGIRAFGFDASGELLKGWPVDLDVHEAQTYFAARVVGDVLTLFAWKSPGDLVDDGQPAANGWIMTIVADGTVGQGARVGYGSDCCLPEMWAIGPDKVAYGVMRDVTDSGTEATSELVAVSVAGVPNGFPVDIVGVASTPAFDAAGRIHVTVATVSVDSPYHGPARTLVFDAEGRSVAGGSAIWGSLRVTLASGSREAAKVPRLRSSEQMARGSSSVPDSKTPSRPG